MNGKRFWMCVPLPEVHCSLVLLTAMWDQMRFGYGLDMTLLIAKRQCGLVVSMKLEETSAQLSVLKTQFGNTVPFTCLSLPACKSEYLSTSLGNHEM